VRSGRSLGALALAFGLALGPAGCAIQPATNDDLSPAWRFSYVSTEIAPTMGYQLEKAHVVHDVEVVVMSRTILWIPTRVTPPTLEEAVSQALREGGGNLLRNAVVERFAWYVPPFYGEEGWRVRGDVLRVERRAESESSAPDGSGGPGASSDPSQPPADAQPSDPP